jgi:glutamate--cysteine ligase
MPSPARCLTAGDAERLVRDQCLQEPVDLTAPRVGVELEWLTFAPGRPGDRPEGADVLAAAAAGGPLRRGGAVTVEPGGQVELSSPALPLAAAVEATAVDAAELRSRLAAAGITTVAAAVDTCGRPLRRVVDLPRYRAMEAYFDRTGIDGRTMMCATAAVQVNVDLGHDASVAARRWQRLHTLGPTLAAVFAASPFDRRGRPSGCRSTRLTTWWAIDPSRSAPVGGVDPCVAWTRYALDAQVMLVRRTPDRYEVPGPMSMRSWLADGHELGWPTADDLAYHLTTLFPPIRPKRWLEVRFPDALGDRWWPVAVAVVAALTYDDDAGDRAAVAAAGSEYLWATAARDGLGHPSLARAAPAVMQSALAGLAALAAPMTLIDTVAAYVDRYTAQGRSPADHLLDLAAVRA